MSTYCSVLLRFSNTYNPGQFLGVSRSLIIKVTNQIPEFMSPQPHPTFALTQSVAMSEEVYTLWRLSCA